MFAPSEVMSLTNKTLTTCIAMLLCTNLSGIGN